MKPRSPSHAPGLPSTRTRRGHRIRLLMLGLVAAMSACSNAPVVPPTQFPKPVLNRIPVTMGLYMDEAFRSYRHQDQPTKESTMQEVSVGPASQSLFSEFLSAQFSSLVTLDRAPAPEARAPVQAVLQPVVQEVQIQSPRTDKDSFHEAWIKYRLRLLTPDGRELTSWELAAYGKERGQFIGGVNAGLTAAMTEAMRDAAAGMALIFRDSAGFAARLSAAGAANAPPPGASAAPGVPAPTAAAPRPAAGKTTAAAPAPPGAAP